MQKETFITAIEALEKQLNYDKEVSKNLGKAFKNAFEANLLPDNHFLTNALIYILQKEMNDLNSDSWIELFCYENNFGKGKLKAYDKENNVIKLNNASDLFNLLNK